MLMPEQEQIESNKSELWNMSIKDLFFKYIRFLPLFLLSAAFALFVAYVYLRYSTEIFSTSGTILLKSDENNSGGANDQKFNSLFQPGSNQNIQNEMEVLKSRQLMERVVKMLDLQKSIYAVGRFKDMNLYKASPFGVDIFELADSAKGFSMRIKFVNDSLFYVGRDTKRFTFGQVFQNKYGVFRLIKKPWGTIGDEYDIKWRPLLQSSLGFAGGINVQPKAFGTGIITISMENPNPQMATDIINQLMVEYQIRSVEEKNISAGKTIEFIAGRLEKLGDEIDSVAKIKLAYQEKNDLLDVESQSTSYFTAISDADNAINLAQDKSNMADLLVNYLSDQKNVHEPFRMVPSSLGLEDPTLNGLVTGYNTAQLERKAMIDGGTTPDNPIIRQADGQIEKIRQSLLENLKNIKTATNSQIIELRRRGNFAKEQAKLLPAKSRNLLEIDQVLQGKQSLYNYLAEKKEETSITLASNTPNSTILDNALVPSIPVKPNRKSFQLLAIILGLGIPGLIIFIGEVINDKITMRFDIERITRSPILGEVGHSYGDGAMVVTATSRGMVAEQFRIIRSNLQYVLTKAEKQVILVTSSFSGEGKSFVTTNLGAAMSLSGKKTIILEFDIRKPKILLGLKMPKADGITNYLLGQAKLGDLPLLVPGYENLYVLPCGPVPPNPAELLLENKVHELFDYLKNHFDVVLIDTAPVGMVSDAMTLGNFADCSLYIVRQGYTYKKQIIMIDEFYKESKLPKISIVINDVKLKPGYGYYGYGRYGYGYGYGQGYYTEDGPKPGFFERMLDYLDPKKIWKGITGK
jgi:capsular exopolysaccharide synthesis family protein